MKINKNKITSSLTFLEEITRFDEVIFDLLKAGEKEQAEHLLRLNLVHQTARNAFNGISFNEYDTVFKSIKTPDDLVKNTIDFNDYRTYKKILNNMNNKIEKDSIYNFKREVLHPKDKKEIENVLLLRDRIPPFYKIDNSDTNRYFINKVKDLYKENNMKAPVSINLTAKELKRAQENPTKFGVDKDAKYFVFGSGKYNNELAFNRQNRYFNSPEGLGGSWINVKENFPKIHPNTQYAFAVPKDFDEMYSKIKEIKYYADKQKMHTGDIPEVKIGKLKNVDYKLPLNVQEEKNEIIIPSDVKFIKDNDKFLKKLYKKSNS